MDGSSHILRRFDPQDTCFRVVDLCQGFHQIPLVEESRDIFMVTLLSGKFCYTFRPQGCSVSSDFFYIFINKHIHG